MTETTDSMLDVNLDDGGDFETLADNSEHELMIKVAEVVENKSDASRDNLVLTLEKPDSPEIDDLRYNYVPIPSAGQRDSDPKAYKKAVNYFKAVCECFGITPPFNIVQDGDRRLVHELVGMRGTCIVEESMNPNTSRMQNRVRRYVTAS